MHSFKLNTGCWMNLCYQRKSRWRDSATWVKKPSNMGYEGNWPPDQLHLSSLFCTLNMVFIAHWVIEVLSSISAEKSNFTHIHTHTLIHAVCTFITNIKSVKWQRIKERRKKQTNDQWHQHVLTLTCSYY